MVILDLCLRNIRSGKSRDCTDYQDAIALFSECFPYTLKLRVGVFKFLEERQVTQNSDSPDSVDGSYVSSKTHYYMAR